MGSGQPAVADDCLFEAVEPFDNDHENWQQCLREQGSNLYDQGEQNPLSVSEMVQSFYHGHTSNLSPAFPMTTAKYSPIKQLLPSRLYDKQLGESKFGQ